MDPSLLRHYELELQHLREMGGEFAKEFPKIAGRLALDGFECADPYVERLLEGFSFLAARVQLKIDAEFPRLTQHLFEVLNPQYLSPTPSMLVAQLQPELVAGGLENGYVVPRGTSLRSRVGNFGACEYRTGRDVQLWPIELQSARYFRYGGELNHCGLPKVANAKAGLRLKLRAAKGIKFNTLSLDNLGIYLRGSDALPMQLYELFFSQAIAVVLHPGAGPAAFVHALAADQVIKPQGFDDDEALLPVTTRNFSGYRLLQEYFAFPQRFMFVELCKLQGGVRACSNEELDIVILFANSMPALEQLISADNFGLHCAPAINLFPHRADRILLTHDQSEYQVIADRTRPVDFEVHSITSVTGYGDSTEVEQKLAPLYQARESSSADTSAYYQLRRTRRMLSERERKYGARSSYVGSEVWLSFVDAMAAPLPMNLRQVGIETLCTNRDLPLTIPLGIGSTDFSLDSGAPVTSVRCVDGPSRPIPCHQDGATVWRLVSHLSLNYLSLINNDPKKGAQALREMLQLYAPNDSAAALQIDGVRSISSAQITRRLLGGGPVTFGRGLEVNVTMDEAAFSGSGIFLLGAVLNHFFARYTSLNSFTETVLTSTTRGQVKRWPARLGQCKLL